jgi:hypothetical protein
VKVEICVSGCDDSTHVTMETTYEQMLFLQQVAEKVTEASTYGCMPRMEIKPEI